MLAELFDTHYVLAVFDTPDEKPIENVIREFSAGDLRALDGQ